MVSVGRLNIDVLLLRWHWRTSTGWMKTCSRFSCFSLKLLYENLRISKVEQLIDLLDIFYFQ